MNAQTMIEPVLPMEAEQLPLMEAAADLRTEVAGVVAGRGGGSRGGAALFFAGDEFLLPQQDRGAARVSRRSGAGVAAAVFFGSGCAPPSGAGNSTHAGGSDAGAGSASDGMGRAFQRRMGAAHSPRVIPAAGRGEPRHSGRAGQAGRHPGAGGS